MILVFVVQKHDRTAVKSLACACGEMLKVSISVRSKVTSSSWTEKESRLICRDHTQVVVKTVESLRNSKSGYKVASRAEGASKTV